MFDNTKFSMSVQTFSVIISIIGLGVASIIVRRLGQEMPLWTMAFLVVPTLWAMYSRITMDPRKKYNKSVGLDADWQPTQYLGPGLKTETYRVITPNGIQVYSRGFELDNFPEIKEQVKARVILADIDQIWINVRDSIAKGSDTVLTKEEKIRIGKLHDNYPIVNINPTIWWDQNNMSYVSGTATDIDVVHVTVWYKTVVAPIQIKNWCSLLEREFKNICYLSIGRRDLTS